MIKQENYSYRGYTFPIIITFDKKTKDYVAQTGIEDEQIVIREPSTGYETQDINFLMGHIKSRIQFIVDSVLDQE